MDISYYKKYEPIFGSWKIVREIGEGSFGKVFEIERKDFGYTYKAALKAITIPQNKSEVDRIMDDGMDSESVTEYFRGFVQELIEEFHIMSRLKGESTIVSYEDHRVIEHSDGIGWDVLIRMELLTPLTKHAKDNELSRDDVIRLGIDICKALELCRKNNIIHRDIKPENVFVSENGRFKLGDFGIAKTVEKTTGGLSKKGTYTYMAPEVYKGEKYGPSVDIYSLGIMLYRYMNNNRTPFLPDFPQPIKYTDRETALARRVGGEEIPAPVNADAELAKIILKACAYNPKERYSSPTEMREALEAVAAKSVSAPMAEEPAAVEDSSKDDATVGIFSSVKPTVEEESKVAEPSLSGAETVKETPVLPEEDTPEDNGDKTEVILDTTPKIKEPEEFTEEPMRVTAPPVETEGRASDKLDATPSKEEDKTDGVVTFEEQASDTANETATKEVQPTPEKAKSKAGLIVLLVVALGIASYFLFVHDWQPATCYEAEYCSICGKHRGEPLEHDWQPATCYEAKYCSICGETQGTKLGHDWLPATYDTPKTCSRCGETLGYVKGWVGDMDGNWAENGVSLAGWTVYPLELDEPVTNCRCFRLPYQLTECESGFVLSDTHDVYIRNENGQWEKIYTLSYDHENRDEADYYISFDSPGKTFDAIVTVPTSYWGKGSFGNWYWVYDVQVYED